MNDLDTASELTLSELTETRATAERVKHQRGSQGLWARRWLRLDAMYQTMQAERDGFYYEAMERVNADD